jgi:hypothetical protein
MFPEKNAPGRGRPRAHPFGPFGNLVARGGGAEPGPDVGVRGVVFLAVVETPEVLVLAHLAVVAEGLLRGCRCVDQANREEMSREAEVTQIGIATPLSSVASLCSVSRHHQPFGPSGESAERGRTAGGLADQSPAERTCRREHQPIELAPLPRVRWLERCFWHAYLI